MQLSGIGEARALDIISYREKHGAFKRIEDIKNVSGIKDAAFNKIKDYSSETVAKQSSFQENTKRLYLHHIGLAAILYHQHR